VRGDLYYWVAADSTYQAVAIDETTGEVDEPFSADKDYFLRY